MRFTNTTIHDKLSLNTITNRLGIITSRIFINIHHKKIYIYNENDTYQFYCEYNNKTELVDILNNTLLN